MELTGTIKINETVVQPGQTLKYNEEAFKIEDASLTGTPSADTDLVTKKYVDDQLAAHDTAAEIPVTATGFNGNLTTSDNTVQKVAQKFDDYVPSVPVSLTQLSSQTLTQANWTEGATYWEYEFSNVNILSTSYVNLVIGNTSLDVATTASIMPEILVENGKITIYAENEPASNITCDIVIIGGTSIVQVDNVLFDKDDFVADAPYYKYEYSNVNIGVGSYITIVPTNATLDSAIQASLMPQITVAAGKATLFVENQPLADFNVNITII